MSKENFGNKILHVLIDKLGAYPNLVVQILEGLDFNFNKEFSGEGRNQIEGLKTVYDGDSLDEKILIERVLSFSKTYLIDFNNILNETLTNLYNLSKENQNQVQILNIENLGKINIENIEARREQVQKSISNINKLESLLDSYIDGRLTDAD